MVATASAVGANLYIVRLLYIKSLTHAQYEVFTVCDCC